MYKLVIYDKETTLEDYMYFDTFKECVDYTDNYDGEDIIVSIWEYSEKYGYQCIWERDMYGR